jgi:S-adenosylmethionine hydrolase
MAALPCGSVPIAGVLAPEFLTVPGKIEGTVISISETGNLVTDITADHLRDAPRDETVAIRCDEHETQGIFTPDHQEPEATFLAVLGPDGRLELEIVGVSASMMLGIRVGEKVVVKW